ncbi:MAG TPA: DUF1405 domain-containing protein [Candidatus Thermoplasmatota archaeon]|nr:DUF1405 domain-containing protein [Candidatus Thermoplasmatota archaeon]
MSERPWSTLHRFKTDWRLLAPLLVLNLAGMVFGYYYYWQVGQFDPSSPYYQPPWTWPLVADSPNAVLLFFVATLAYRLRQWRNRWLDAFAFTLNVYVGCWTTFLFLAYPDRMGTFDYASVADGNANPILFLAHMGMPLQAFVLARDMRTDRWSIPALATVLAVLTTYIVVDYWGPVLHPAPFLHPGDGLLHAWSPWIMVAAGLAWLALVAPRRRRPNMDFGEPGEPSRKSP